MHATATARPGTILTTTATHASASGQQHRRCARRFEAQCLCLRYSLRTLGTARCCPTPARMSQSERNAGGRPAMRRTGDQSAAVVQRKPLTSGAGSHRRHASCRWVGLYPIACSAPNSAKGTVARLTVAGAVYFADQRLSPCSAAKAATATAPPAVPGQRSYSTDAATSKVTRNTTPIRATERYPLVCATLKYRGPQHQLSATASCSPTPDPVQAGQGAGRYRRAVAGLPHSLRRWPRQLLNRRPPPDRKRTGLEFRRLRYVGASRRQQ